VYGILSTCDEGIAMSNSAGVLPVFDASDNVGNIEKLMEYFVRYFDFKGSSNCSVNRYTINSSLGSSVTGSKVLDEYGLTLLLHYLFLLSIPANDKLDIKQGEIREFQMTYVTQALAFTYFGTSVSSEAIENRDTENFAIRALLSDGAKIFLEFS
jgi:hypothetical protein